MTHPTDQSSREQELLVLAKEYGARIVYDLPRDLGTPSKPVDVQITPDQLAKLVACLSTLPPTAITAEEAGREGEAGEVARLRETVAGLVALIEHDAPEALEDTRRLDWLESKTVNVRTTLRYGSHNLFWAGPSDDDGLPVKSDLRARIDAAMLPSAPAQSGGQGNG